jgi:hypothetical protein
VIQVGDALLAGWTAYWTRKFSTSLSSLPRRTTIFESWASRSSVGGLGGWVS